MSRPGQQPVSYRTVPGRHRTQKWQAAARQNYDGDDWGDYDPYDEYGGGYGEEEEQQQPPLPQQIPPGAAQQQFGARPPRRMNSFDQGDEGRMFATAAGPSSTAQFPPYDPRFASPPAPGHRRPSNDDLASQNRQRDFSNPDHVPPPLNTRPSPTTADRFPPRKSSLTGNTPVDIHSTSHAPIDSASEPQDKPLPFIRPSDIYKRIPEELERERRSEDTSRPTLDSIQRDAEPGLASGPRTNLATVAESRESRLFMDEPSQTSSVNNKLDQAPAVPLASTDLHHQPSHGFRSAVHHAFDRAGADSPLARDDSSTIGRSNTTSTSAISPITSNIPHLPLAQQVAQIDDRSGPHSQHPLPRKPSPDRTTMANVEPGYRRSLDPPISEQSHAHHPALGSNDKLSFPMMAETVPPESPAIPDQAAEIPEATLHPTSNLPLQSTQSTTGRARSGTDFSVREADLANTVNASPDGDKLAETVAEAEANQDLFLSTHAGIPPNPPSTSVADGPSTSSAGTPANGGPNSPSKGRVREIADQFQEIHNASRRGSEASIGSNRSRKDTTDSVEASSSPSATRPAIDREQSFVPQLPGGWISSAPTPTAELSEFGHEEDEQLSPPTPRVQEPIDLAPTTRKVQLQEIHRDATSYPLDSGPAPFDAVRNAGDELGAALLASMGMGHHTHDFASKQPAEPVQQPQKNPSTISGPVTAPALLWRQNTYDSDTMTEVTSSVPPTPLPKDTPKEDAHDQTPTASDHLAAGYFATAVPPLRLSSKQPSAEPLDRAPEQPTSLAAKTLSTVPGADDTESDRLRKEIVRSLEATDQETSDDVHRTQDTLDAPENARKLEQNIAPPPRGESIARPNYLDQRFSWETPPAPQDTRTHMTRPPVPVVAKTPEPESPEIKPERAYERPRSSVLHIMNADIDDASPTESVPELRIPEVTEAFHPSASLDAPTEHDNLRPEVPHFGSESPAQSFSELAPAPISDRALSVDSGPRLPSYYLGNNQSESFLETPDYDAAGSQSFTSDPEADQPSDEPSKPKVGPIPQFRNILAIKSSEERIRTYDQTRQTFAEMNTGLSDWLTNMLDTHPEHADVAAGKLQTSATGTFKRGHKPSPSMLKFTKPFVENQKSASGPSEDVVAASQRRSSVPGNDRMDMDKVSQRGKDLMKSAGVLGGKAQAGAKGLFAKGKSKFGTRKDSDKALFASSTTSTPIFSSPLPPPDLPVSDNPVSLRGGAATPPPPSSTPPPRSQPSDSYLALRPSLSLTSKSRNSSASPDITAPSRHRSNLSQTLSIFRSGSKSKAKAKSPASSRSHLDPNSRPSSLVLPKPDPMMLQQGFDISRPAEESEFRHTDLTPTMTAFPSRTSTLGSKSKSRKELWEEQPDDGNQNVAGGGRLAIPVPGNFDNIEDRRRHLERLGVLPSPAETMKTFDFGSANASPTSVRRSGEGGLSSSPIRTRRERKGSDLASLPSQIRRKSVASTLYAKDKEAGGEREETVFQANPVTVRPAQPVLVTNMNVAKKKEEEEEEAKDVDDDQHEATPSTPRAIVVLEKSTPKGEIIKEAIESSVKPEGVGESAAEYASEDRAPSTAAVEPRSESNTTGEETNQTVSAQNLPDQTTPKPDFAIIHQSENREDNQSEISAEERVPIEEPRRDSAVSRRSSVSSLDGHDLTMTTSETQPGVQNDMEEPPIMSAQAVPAGPIGPSATSSPAIADRSRASNARPGPTGTASQEALEYRERFANRLYQPPPDESRPLSYDPLERDSNGALVQETLPSSEQAIGPDRRVRSPLGVSSFQPHPTVRTAVQPTEYERLRTSVSIPIEPDIIRQPNLSDNTKVKKSLQFPAILRKNKQLEPEIAPASKSAPPRNIETSAARPVTRPQHEEKQGRRRSVVLDSILARRPSLAERGQLENINPTSNMQASPSVSPQAVPDDAESTSEVSKSRPNTLRKPQRSASTASSKEAETKKKRFSGLGMLFGRSSTTGHAAANKPSRLSKPPPQSKEPVPNRGSQAPPVPRPAEGSNDVVTGSVRGYEEFEARRRREMPAFQENATRFPVTEVERPPSARREPKLPNLQSMPEESVMPATGSWYSPDDRNERPDTREPMQAPAGPLPMDYRRMPGSGNREASHLSGIPESFRPTQASSNVPAQRIGLPPGQPQQDPQGVRGPPSSMFQPRPPSYSGTHPVALGNTPRQSSYSSEVSQLSRQLSGDSDPRATSVSPLQARNGNEGYPMPRQSRSNSIGRQLTRSPHGEFSEPPPQTQMAWGPRRPYDDNGAPQQVRERQGPPRSPPHHLRQQQQQWYPRREERPPFHEDQYNVRRSHSEYGPARHHVYHPPYQAQPGGLRFTPEAPNSAGYASTSRFSQRPPIPPPSQQYWYDAYHEEVDTLASPPYSPAAPSTQPPPPQFHQQRGSQLQQPGLPHTPLPLPPSSYHRSTTGTQPYHGGGLPDTRQQRTFYEDTSGPAAQSWYPQQQQQQRRRSSRGNEGYTGRRDDPTAREEEDMQMRGASYPGQEWMPEGLHRDWD